MNKTLLVSGLAAMALAAAAGVAVAQQTPERPVRAMRADTDGDSRLSRAEFVDGRVQRLTAMDADRDGSVSAEERRAGMQARMAARADARFDRLDADDNGSVSRAEFDAARPARGEGRAAHGPRPMRAHPGEGHGPRGMAGTEGGRGPVVIAEVQTRAGQHFDRLDSDHDGFVTAEEGRAGRQAMREHRRARMVERRATRQASPPAPASE